MSSIGSRDAALPGRAGGPRHRENRRDRSSPLGELEESVSSRLRHQERTAARQFIGRRAGEARGMSWAGVDFDSGVARLAPGVTKNREGREFPIATLPPLAELLREQRERTTAVERKQSCIVGPVFHRNGKPILSYVRA